MEEERERAVTTEVDGSDRVLRGPVVHARPLGKVKHTPVLYL